MPVDYDHDVAAWATEQAGMIRAGRFEQLDARHLAEEIESLGKSEQRELMSRLAVLLAHLLKWQFQPSHRGRSWELTIAEQRAKIDVLLDDSPSLRGRLDDETWISKAWKQAMLLAEKETGLDGFPLACPWVAGKVIEEDWLPE